MRLLITTVALLAVAALSVVSNASAEGASPAQLERAGWDCFYPGDFNPNIHCAPPGQLPGIEAGSIASAHLLAFDTPDLTATQAPLLGTERLLRADLFHNQPCPTDPPGPPGATTRSNSPQYEWTYLGPKFGWNYYICHTFDSAW